MSLNESKAYCSYFLVVISLTFLGNIYFNSAELNLSACRLNISRLLEAKLLYFYSLFKNYLCKNFGLWYGILIGDGDFSSIYSFKFLKISNFAYLLYIEENEFISYYFLTDYFGVIYSIDLLCYSLGELLFYSVLKGRHLLLFD